MEIVESNLVIEESTKKIKIAGLSREIIIDYSADVDFTDFVGLLSEYIDSDKSIKISNTTTTEDEKLKKIIETIDEIISKYNENIIHVADDSAIASVEGEDNLPF